MANPGTVVQYLECVNQEVDGGCGEVERECFSWGLGDKLQ